MPFDKVETQQVDFPAQERAILDFWQRTDAFNKLRVQNLGKPTWSFLDGPITANNPMGVHHAWGRTYKDAYQRYFAMTGHELRYQNGFDCQGLWVEVEVEKELGLRSKRDIEDLVPGDRFASIDRFVQLCKRRVDKFALKQTEQSIRLGYWMDWDRAGDWDLPPDQRHSYFTMSEENNYTIWSFLKKCHGRGLVYKGYDAMPWCPRCGVGISQMEMHEGYQLVAHRAVFVRFPLRNRPGENLLVWTTTPWTLTSNVAAAVNPELTYLRVQHRDQVYYLARGAFTAHRLEEQFKRKEWVPGVPKLKTLEQVFKEKGGYEVLGQLSGADMIGWEYDGPFDELPAQRAARAVHRVIPWQEVGELEGTGIVHIAPGCGREDFQLGKEENLPPVAPLDDAGNFLPGFGELTGKYAVADTTTDSILHNLKEKGLLLEVEKYPHSYPHCWRCKTELLFRLVDEWYINMNWRDEIKEVVRQVKWLPEAINGQARELDWLSNMGDWMISKKRFWGLALPIWVCEECETFDVVGGRDELRDRAVAGWQEFEGHTPHRPWIDLVKVRCTHCGGQASRIPDVGNPWLDAGIVPYSTLGYNHDRQAWEKWFPADFVTESFPGQFRNWFYALLAMSTMMTGRPPFQVLLGHGQVRDQWGEEMHKSKGNAIPFEGAAEEGYTIKHRLKPGEPVANVSGARATRVVEENLGGEKVRDLVAECPPMSADLIRWLYCRHNPAANINFGPSLAEEIRSKFELKLWNTYAFFCNYARLDGFDANAPAVPVGERPDIDRWILSDLQKLIRTARQSFERFDVQTLCLDAERFIDDKLSNWYVRRNRPRFWKNREEGGTDKQAAYQTLYTVLVTLTKLLAPVIPFLTEEMYQNLVIKGTQDARQPLSVHLCAYPEADETLVDEQLSDDMEALLRLVSLGSAARNTVKTKVRQPLAEMKVQPAADSDRRAVERFADQVRDELNVKKVTLHDNGNGPLLRAEVKPNMKTWGLKFGARIREVQTALAAADPATVAAQVQAGESVEVSTPQGSVTLEPADVLLQFHPPESWAGVADRGTQVALDTRITEELKREGWARDVVRQVQELRKEACLEMNDRIVLYLGTEAAALREAIEEHRAYIGGQTQVARWAAQPPDGDAHQANVRIDGQPLHIALQRAGA